MKLIHRLTAVILLSVCCATPAVAADDGGGFSDRIEAEYKLSVPPGLGPAVWAYLRHRYASGVVPERHGLAEARTSFSTEYFIDEYFDDAGLSLLRSASGLRHRTRYVPDGGSKDGRELLQLKLPVSADGVARREVKFDVMKRAIPRNRDESHPLLGLLGDKDRGNLLRHLDAAGLRADTMHARLTIYQTRQRVYVYAGGEPFATITVDEVSAFKWGAPISFFEIEMELNENAYTAANAEGRASMERINDAMKDDLLRAFPAIAQDQTPKYNKVFQAYESVFVGFPYSLRLGVPLEGVVLLGLAVLMVLGLAWRLKRDTVIHRRAESQNVFSREG